MTEPTQDSSQHRTPESPRGLPILGHVHKFAGKEGIPIHYLQDNMEEYGDITQINLMSNHFYVVAHPDYVHEILVKQHQNFEKYSPETVDERGLAAFLGQGILTANHEVWRPQRKLIQPLMHTGRIAHYADTMTHYGEKLLSLWQDGAVRDISMDMTQVTLWIIAKTMFDTELDNTPELESAGHEAQKLAIADMTSPFNLPSWLPTPRNSAVKHVNDTFDTLIYQMIQQRRQAGDPERKDLLTLLMQASDEDGNLMPDDFVRDNILTLYLAGHETTANTLTWVFYHLDKNPEVAQKLYEEVDSVLEGRTPTLDDLPNLPYTLMVIKEAMRIEPTVPTTLRYVVEDTEIGDYELKGGWFVLLPFYLIHHDERWWDAPEVFNPERFTEENEAKIPKYAYVPFGGGPRVCIGNHFALMEAQLLLAQLTGQYRLELLPDAEVKQERYITTRALDGLPMRLVKRA